MYVHSNLDLGVVSVSRGTTPKSREILNQGFSNVGQKAFIKLQKRFSVVLAKMQCLYYRFYLKKLVILDCLLDSPIFLESPSFSNSDRAAYTLSLAPLVWTKFLIALKWCRNSTGLTTSS